MALGRRTRRSERSKIDATPPWQTERERDTPQTTGPWDERDAPDDGLERLDLGALRIPVVAGVEVRVDVGPDGGVVAATLSHAGSEAQVGAFAAPRTAGIWDEIRTEIRGTIAAQGGTAQESDGRFGTELAGKVPVPGGGFQSVRFVGVDGPRWFLRALFSGPAATDRARAAVLEDAVRGMIVLRGSLPLPVRDPLPLELPEEIAEQAAAEHAAAHAAADGSEPVAVEPARPARPAQPGRPTQQTQPAEQTQPGQPTQQTQPGQPGQPAEQTQPGQPAEQTQPGQPAEQTQPGQPAATEGRPAQPRSGRRRADRRR